MGSGASSAVGNLGDIRPDDGPALAGTAIALQGMLKEKGLLSFDQCVECFSLYKNASTTITDNFPGFMI